MSLIVNCEAIKTESSDQWRKQKIFMGGGLVQGHMVVICI